MLRHIACLSSLGHHDAAIGNQCRSLAARASKQRLFEKVGIHQTQVSIQLHQNRVYGMTAATVSCMTPLAAMQEGFGITLDRHLLRTPSKNPLVLPSKALALAVAAEWRWQVPGIQVLSLKLKWQFLRRTAY